MKQELTTLFHSSKSQLKEPGDLQDTLSRIASIAQEYFSTDLCVIFPMNPVTHIFLREAPTVKGSLSKANKNAFALPREDGLAKSILSKKILLAEESNIKKYRSTFTDAEKIRSFAGVALFTARMRRPLAVIYLDYRKPKKFDKKFSADLTTFIEFATSELQNTWFIRRYREIVRIGQDINENLEDIDLMFEKVFAHMKGIMDVSYYMSLACYDSRLNSFDLFLYERGQKSIKKKYIFEKDSITPSVIRNMETIKIDDLGKPDKIPPGIRPAHIEDTSDEEKSLLFVPIKLTKQPLGVLSVQHPARNYYDDEDRQILELLANHMALALNNNRLLDDLRSRRSTESKILREIDREISQILDRDKILQTILRLTIKHINADTGVILLLNKKINAIEAKAAIGENLRPLEQQVYPLDQFQGIAKTAFETKSTIRISDVRTDPTWKNKYSENSPNTISELDVPLILGDEAIGVMNFESSRESAFSQEEQSFMETLAGQAVIAIKNAIEYERANRIAKDREALIEIVNTLLLQTDQKEIFRIILNKALEITETSKGTINTCDDDRREFKIAAHSNLNPEWKHRVQSYDEGIIGKVAREKKIIKIDQISVDPLREDFIDAFSGEEESELAVPILDGERVMGVINLESENSYHFEEDDVELVKSLASLCAIALKNAEIVHQKQLASIGLVTGDIAHKMNSPLSKIRKQVELIQTNSQETLASNDYLADKIAQIDKMLSETLAMIQTTVNDAKRSFGEIENTSLRICIKRALNEIEVPDNISVDDNISDEGNGIKVLATPELTSVFHNLISNAIRAMPDGGKISLMTESINERWVIISVEDTGKGIPEEVAPLVYRVSERGETGHGFGLPLTKAYIEMIGGSIGIPTKGKNGIGAKFTIHLRKAQVSG